MTKEALKVELSSCSLYSLISVFFTDAVALLTLTLVSIDHITVPVFPVRHYKGIKKRKENVLVIVVWPLTMLLVIPYFQLKFIRQLLVFSSKNIAVTILSLIVTTITYIQQINVKKYNRNKKERKKEY